MRNDQWLNLRLNQIWNSFFPDIQKNNNVIIKFKGRWKNKFGHIKKLKNKNTEIAVNGLFKDEKIPEFIINITIAHELVHYSHGFNSPLPKKFRYPHQGGVVKKELIERGFSNSLKKEKYFIKKEWPLIYKELMPHKKSRRRRFRFF